MKENIEEDIEILEELQQDFINLVSKKFVIEEDERRAQITAIEHILSDYKRVLKENEELKKFITEGITIEPNSPYKNYQLDFLRKNFISVQKVKDKIEELDKKIVSEENEKVILWLHKQRNILQELLEEKGE